jgi:ribosomal protein S24E
MEHFTVTHEKENPLFKRKEVVITLHSSASPTSANIKKQIAEKFSSPEEAIKIKQINGNFGSNEFTIIANVYHSEKDKNKLEPETVKAKPGA